MGWGEARMERAAWSSRTEAELVRTKVEDGDGAVGVLLSQRGRAASGAGGARAADGSGRGITKMETLWEGCVLCFGKRCSRNWGFGDIQTAGRGGIWAQTDFGGNENGAL